MTEEWRPVRGCEGFYEVSNLGNVRSLPREVHTYGGRKYVSSGRILKPHADRDGYLDVRLSVGGNIKAGRVHILVLEAFVRPREEGEVARHLDGHPENNRLDNLAWGTHAENHHDCYTYGGRHGRGKLYAEQVREIKKRLAAGERKTDLAREYGVHFMNIHAIATGTHFGYLDN